MTFLRWLVRIHKWVALVVGLQIVLWVAGGVVMSVIPIEIVRGEHKIAKAPDKPLALVDIKSVGDAAKAIGTPAIKSAALGKMLGAPVWRIEEVGGAVHTIDARTGSVLSPLSKTLAQKIAESDYAGAGALKSIEQLDTPPAEYGRPGPVWRAQFDDRDKTTLYIDPQKGEVAARRSETWRFYDFFWKLHIMDYDDGSDFNHPLLITAAGTAIFVALSGFILLIIKMRRSLIVWLKSRNIANAISSRGGKTV
jgi:hypothetical protein